MNMAEWLAASARLHPHAPALLTGVRELLARPDHYRALYRVDAGGHFRHRTFAAPAETLFDPEATLDRVLARLNASNDML